MWITAALAAIQMISGMASNSKKQAAKRAEISGVDKPAAATVEATQRNRIKANATTAPGEIKAKEFARQTSADVIGNAKRTAKDSSKLSAATTRAGILQDRAGQRIAANAEVAKVGDENRFQASLGRLGVEQRQGAQAKDQIFMEAETAKANLLGAGVNNFLTMGRDKHMMKFYSKLYGSGDSGFSFKQNLDYSEDEYTTNPS